MAQWQSLLLVFARVSAFMAVGPLFALRFLPPLVKAGTALALAVLVAPVVPARPAAVDVVTFSLAAMVEVLLGLALGYVATLVLHAIRMAGQLVDLQTGLALADLLDPEAGAGITVLGEFFYLLGLLLLFQMDGHHGMLQALADSFRWIPPAAAAWQGTLAGEMARVFSSTFALAFRLAVPLVAVLLVCDVALALVARTVPQLNVFVVGLPLKFGLGLVMLIVILPLLAGAFGQVFHMVNRDMDLICRCLSGS